MRHNIHSISKWLISATQYSTHFRMVPYETQHTFHLKMADLCHTIFNNFKMVPYKTQHTLHLKMADLCQARHNIHYTLKWLTSAIHNMHNWPVVSTATVNVHIFFLAVQRGAMTLVFQRKQKLQSATAPSSQLVSTLC